MTAAETMIERMLPRRRDSRTQTPNIFWDPGPRSLRHVQSSASEYFEAREDATDRPPARTLGTRAPVGLE